MILELEIYEPLEDKIDYLEKNYSNISEIILNGLKEFDYRVIDGSRELVNKLIWFASNCNIKLHILTSCHQNYKLLPETKNVTIHNWPTYYLTITFLRLINNPTYTDNKNLGFDFYNDKINKNSKINYPYLSLNNIPKLHRVIMMDMLGKYNIIQKDCITWRKKMQPGLYQLQYWNEKVTLIDQYESLNNVHLLPSIYTNSFIQLVTESDDSIFILSEKTATPLFLNKPFIVAAGPHFHKILSELGFKLYDELFDYSFDDELNLSKRYELIAKNINRYANKSHDELYKLKQSVFSKCLYNRKLAMKLSASSSLVPNIFQKCTGHESIEVKKFIRENEKKYSRL